MKSKSFLALLLCLSTGLYLQAQTMRYFEFTTGCGHGHWQDSSFIAAASDPGLIDSVLANIARPEEARKFISGPIDYSNGGHNRNAGHWFLWHFQPDQWNLVENAIEVCDGCPFSDVDADTAYWVGNIGSFCPWTAIPVREVTPTGIMPVTQEGPVQVYPNPATDKLYLRCDRYRAWQITIFDLNGKNHLDRSYATSTSIIDLSAMPSGMYFVKIQAPDRIYTQKLVIR